MGSFHPLHGNGLLAGRFLSCLVVAGVLFAQPVVAAGVDRQALDAAFDETISRYALPGLAVGIVVDGEVVYQRVHGELAMGEGDAIDAKTIFKVASNSKSMTTALLARLVDQGKLRWDDPVIKHLPDFRMHDDWVTREMQVRDLLIHNSGLGPGAGDLMLWPEPNLFTRADVIAGLRHLKPVYSFRSRYAYDNSLYIVAGEVAAAAGRAPYDVLMRREVFEPLGMTRCQVGEWARDAVGNVAQPHMRRGDSHVVIRRDGETIPDVPMMAAGGLRCSLDDMLAWANAWLQPEGAIVDKSGTPWLSRSQRDELWKTHMPMPLSSRMRRWDRSHFSAYGYGWRLTDVDGTSKVSHTGTLSGMYSAVTLLPELRTGIVFMTNGNGDDARTVLTQVLVKQFTARGQDRLDVAHYAGLLEQERATTRTEEASAAAPDTQARKPVGAMGFESNLGVYRDPWFGSVDVCGVDGGVEFRSHKSPKLSGLVLGVGERHLVDWHDDDVTAEAWLSFAGTGNAHRLTMAKVDPEADFSYDFEDLAFTRVGDCPASGATR